MSQARPRGEGKRRDLPRRIGRLLLAASLAALWGVLVGRTVTLTAAAFFGRGDLSTFLPATGAALGCVLAALWTPRATRPSLWRDLAMGVVAYLLLVYLLALPVEAVHLGIPLREVPGLVFDGLATWPKRFAITYGPVALLTALGARSAANWVREVTSPEPEPTSAGMTRREDGTWDLD